MIADIAHKLGIERGADLVIPLNFICNGAVLSGVIRIFLVWGISLAKFTGADISLDVFRRTLHQPYCTHIARSSSEILSGLTQKVGTAVGAISAVVLIITSGILFLSIMTTLFVIDPIVATISVVVFGSAYIFLALLTRSRVQINGQRCAKEQSHLIKIIQEGLGGIRDIIIDGT